MAAAVWIMAVEQLADNGCQPIAATQRAQEQPHGMIAVEYVVCLLLFGYGFMADTG